MARQPRKQPQSKPIAQHQLFPAVIALWFGALFGLGSLAVRPSLLESLVINSRIDLIVPAAAPPLGITARILVALILAAIGSAIGIAIARRLARPKVEMRERKRSKLAADEPAIQRPYGSTAAPVAEGPILAPRRRALAIEHEEEQFVPHDMAPLPGGVPQILDISSVGFRTEPAEAPLDLGGFPAPSPADPTLPAAFTPLPVTAPEPPRQVFQPIGTEPQLAVETHDSHPATEAAAAAADGRQVFGMPPVAETAQAPKQIFGQPVENEHVSQAFVEAAGFKTTVFDSEEPNPLFPPREQAAAPAAIAPAAPFAQPQPYQVPPAPVVEPYAVPSMEMPPSSLDTSPQREIQDDCQFAPVQPEPVQVATAAPEPIPAPAEPLPSPSGLGMDDLSARLAASMERRRAARAGTPTEMAAPAPEAIDFAPQQTESAAMPEALISELAAPQTPLTAPVPLDREPELQPVPAIAPEQPAPFVPSAPALAAQVAAPAVPAAMRPLELDGFEDDVEPLDHFLPLRHIARAQPATIAAPAMPTAFVAPAEPTAFVAPAEPTDEAEAVQAEVAEDNYASLLGIAPTAHHNSFVRIQEPEPEAVAIEPVVIFPGQMAQPAPKAPFRPFDAPASAGQGQPVSSGDAAPSIDREEADRALRMALANLQRMSGAA